MSLTGLGIGSSSYSSLTLGSLLLWLLLSVTQNASQLLSPITEAVGKSLSSGVVTLPQSVVLLLEDDQIKR